MIDKKPSLSTSDWVLTGLARAFGVCVALREDDLGLTETQIIKRIYEDGKKSINWYKKERDKSKKQAELLKARTEDEWHKVWLEEENRKKGSNEEAIAKASIMLKRHTQVKNDLQRIIESSIVDEVTRNVAQFGLDQLKLVEDDCEPYIDEPVSFNDYRKNEISHNTRDIKYYTEELVKAEIRQQNRIECYQRLRKDVNLILAEKKQEKP